MVQEIGSRYPCSIHGLGLSLGTPGPLDADLLARYTRVARLAQARWATEHIAFTRAGGIDLGHLNPLPPTHANLALLRAHASVVAEQTGLPVCLENITSALRLEGDLSEAQFLNELCSVDGPGLLLDVTNLYINSRNHGFDPLDWLTELAPGIVRQIHIVGYGERDGQLVDDHAAPIQPELLDLLAPALERQTVEAVIIERDLNIPGPPELLTELARVRRALGWD
jgi:uncharacterized protein (UPF0276 family)